ncbi:RNI-like protein [Mollisia scopiformis]|uniref:RNI-like protein n=1 Tax=Mollisia scopiformis TaxID=149040 RepID=A0A194WVV9_MOLSC|nr:RNI-like protein [Mollisia scopiformis]KUJ11727.1 RNI-like protein [Mollisia scopiformis]
MAPSAKENGGGNARRKSFNPLSRASPNHLPQINTDVGNMNADEGEKKDKKKLGKRTSIFGLGQISSPDVLEGGMSPVRSSSTLDSPKTRPRTLQKGRPSSIFGSLGRKSVNHMEDEITFAAGSPISPAGSGEMSGNSSFSRNVLYHGEVQTATTMFRKKKEYLVLTDTHILRFKSQNRASETFPQIPNQFGRSHNARHPSSTSIGSLQEVQSATSHHSAELDNRIPLQQVVTIYKVEDGRPYFTMDVVYLDEEVHGAGSLQLILQDPKEADLWHTSIRGAAIKARLLMTEPYPERVIRYLVAAVEAVDDYSPNCFHIFRVVRRLSAYKGLRASQDDVQKIGNAVYYLVVGMHLVHLIPLPDFHSPKELELKGKKSRTSFGIVSLVRVWVNYDDDRFQLEWRKPLMPAEILELASSGNPDIGYSILKVFHYLKPQWLDTTYNYRGPRPIAEVSDLDVSPNYDYGCFDRTVTAYMIAYGCDPSNLQYAVDTEADFSPEFHLCPPRYSQRYTALELLCVFRSLRYNETFRAISFRGINLHDLHGVYDVGYEHVAITTRGGLNIKKYMNIDPTRKTLLYMEIQALILKSYKLQRLDFANCLPKRAPQEVFDIEEETTGDHDPGCEIVEALMPIGIAELPSVTWLVLSGIGLGEGDIEFMRASLHKPQSRIRAIEMSQCKLDDRLINQMISHLERQYTSMECIDLSNNPGRINLESFQRSMSRYTNLRVINFSKTFWTTSTESILIPKVMLTWKLEQLHLDGISLNANTLDAISTYLASEASNNLQILHLNQCNLTGSDVAFLMHAMCRYPGEVRDFELHVDSNKLERGISEIIKAIMMQHTPSKFSMRMIEFAKEDHFRQLLRALRFNHTIRRLDISTASLPQDANEETCEELRLLFHDNKTLDYFDISGEQSHLETTRFGIGLTYALTGLIGNTTLRTLRIEFQNLGARGADTLASVIEQNTGLQSIYCDHNEITLQGYTSIVNALTKNYTLLVLPFMKSDGFNALKQLHLTSTDYEGEHSWNTPVKPDPTKPPTLRQKLQIMGLGAQKVKKDTTPQDVIDAARLLGVEWDLQMQRAVKLLQRNAKIQSGDEGYDTVDEANARMDEKDLRPNTAISEGTILDQAKNNTTPRVELKDPYDVTTSAISPSTTLANNVRSSEDTKTSSEEDEMLTIGKHARKIRVRNPEPSEWTLKGKDEKTMVHYQELDGTPIPPPQELDGNNVRYLDVGTKKLSFEETEGSPETRLSIRPNLGTKSEELGKKLDEFSFKEVDDEKTLYPGMEVGLDIRRSRSDGTDFSVPSNSSSSGVPELRLPTDEKIFELSEDERAIFAGLES